MSLSKLNAMRSIKSNEIVYLFGDPDTQERIKEDMKNYKDPFNLLFEELNKLIKNN
ncbi:hypothetical protein [Campylobacter sp. LR264d]|nr:hypothetical protein [Campylobacter sp. LR264d]